ncbi:hypothetical protein RQP46_006561 [Phenoliferia psychrophenolica]
MTKRQTTQDSLPQHGQGQGQPHEGSNSPGGSPVLASQDFTRARNNSNSTSTSSPTLLRRHSPLLPSFGSHSKSHSGKQGFLGQGQQGKRRFVPRLLQSRNPHRNRLLAALALVALAAWTVWGRKSHSIVKQRLTTRWWDQNSPSSAAPPPSLLPVPSMLPKPPKLVPPALTSHSLPVLARLPTSFVGATPPNWTALVHLGSSAQLPTLSRLIKTLLKQSVPPSRVLILAPDGLAPSTAKHGPAVSLVSYKTSRPPALAVLLVASGEVATEYVVVIDANLEVVKSSYVRTLLRASGTAEYGHALLSAGGLVLPVSASASPATCLVSDGSADGLDKTAAIHAPSTPFLVETAWLTNPALANGLRTDLPLEVAIALALWTKSGIPSFGLPVPWDEGRRDWGCERLKRAVEGNEAVLASLFRRDSPASLPLPSDTNADAADVAGHDQRQQPDGTIVLLLSGDEELALAHPLACAFAARHDVRVVVADSESAAQGPTVFFADGADRCHLDLHPLKITDSVRSELERLKRVELVVYVQDGQRAREFEGAMKGVNGVFGARFGGARRGKDRVEKEGGVVVIPLVKADVVHSEWIAALPMEALRHWHTPKIDITVITNDRPTSLNRLLTALQDAHYFGDSVSLALNLEQTADRTTQRLVDDFPWSFGPLAVRHRIILGGLMPAIVESWYPSSNDSYGVFLEDDVEVSPMFYSWLKFTILHYRYHSATRARSTRLFGVSLYQQRNIELRLEGRQPFDAHKLFDDLSIPSTSPYLSQIPCSWGAAYFPEVWREFHAYLALRLSETALPITDAIVPEIKSNKWPRSWKKYFIELVYMRGYVMLYPNYADFLSFSTNHLEKGTHIHVDTVDEKRKRQFNVPLMQRNSSIVGGLPGQQLPDWDALPVLDLWGAVASDDDLVERGWQSVAQLDTCPPFRLDVAPTYNARELLCAKVYERTNALVEAQPLAATLSAPLAAQAQQQERPPLVEHPDAVPAAAEERKDGSDADELERLRQYEQRVRQRVVAPGDRVAAADEEIDDDTIGIVADVPSGEEAAAILEREEERARLGLPPR